MTQKTDRELLKFAAKAAGITGEWARWHQAYGDEWVEGLNIGGPLLWNPLTDDGDALRLSVKLGLNIMHMLDCLQPWVDVCGADFDADELYKTDPYAATRRAIVRAAAEIGKAK